MSASQTQLNAPADAAASAPREQRPEEQRERRNAARGHDHRRRRRDEQQHDDARLRELVVVADEREHRHRASRLARRAAHADRGAASSTANARRDEERQEDQRGIDGVRFAQIRRQPQRDVEQTQQHLHRRPARRPSATAARTRDEAACAQTSASAPAAQIERRRRARCDAAFGRTARACRRRRCRRSRGIERQARPAPLELTYAPMHIVDERDDCRQAERDRQRRRRAATLPARASARLGGGGKDGHCGERRDQRHRGCPMQHDRERRFARRTVSAPRKTCAKNRTAITPSVGTTNGERCALAATPRR